MLATAFTLVISIVRAIVLLVPLAVSIAVAGGGDPAVFALTVAVSTSKSFPIPTHQVNAMIKGPADYKLTDFMKSGGTKTVLFLAVSPLKLNLDFWEWQFGTKKRQSLLPSSRKSDCRRHCSRPVYCHREHAASYTNGKYA